MVECAGLENQSPFTRTAGSNPAPSAVNTRDSLQTLSSRAVAVVWLACFLAANVVGSRLWSRRRRLRPFPAIQIGFLVCGVSGLLALTTLHLLRPGLRVPRPAGVHLRDEPWLIPAFLVVVLVLMAQACLLEWSARKERARAKSRA